VVWFFTVVIASEVVRRYSSIAGDIEGRLAVCAAECDRVSALLSDLTESLGEGLLVVDGDLRVRLMNSSARHFCGIETWWEGLHLPEVIGEPEVVEVMEIAAHGTKPDPVLVKNPRGMWELRAFPLRSEGAVVLVADVSDARRSADLRQRFVQDLSHELRSPLAVLRTTVEAVEEEVEPRIAEILVRQIERLDRLTVELYELATIESGQMELHPESIDLPEIIRTVRDDLAPEASRVGVEIVFDQTADIKLLSDRRGVYRVLTNLVDNAIKYNHEGGKVEIAARRYGDEVVVEVADTGEGIPLNELKSVLHRFYRVDRARTPGRGGLGLGLAIVKHLVKHMGGHLELTSREGIGTIVKIVFTDTTS